MLTHSSAGRLTAACCAVLALAGCGASSHPPRATPGTPPAGTTATAAPYTRTGTTLHLGHAAVVPWQDSRTAGRPAGTLRIAVTGVSDGQVAGDAYPDPGAPKSFNDVAFFVHVSVTNTGTVPVRPGGLFALADVYDTKGDPMIPGTTYDDACKSAPGSGPLAPGAHLTTCKPYLGSVLTPHLAKIVFSGFAHPDTTITWTGPRAD